MKGTWSVNIDECYQSERFAKRLLKHFGWKRNRERKFSIYLFIFRAQYRMAIKIGSTRSTKIWDTEKSFEFVCIQKMETDFWRAIWMLKFGDDSKAQFIFDWSSSGSETDSHNFLKNKWPLWALPLLLLGVSDVFAAVALSFFRTLAKISAAKIVVRL